MRNHYMIIASGHYLTEAFPDDWDDLSEHEILSFIEMNKWEPVEDWDPEDILDQINSIADALVKAFEDGKNEQ